MKPVDFLKSESENLKYVLDQTLRYDYGLEGSRDFYEECCARLEYVKTTLATIDSSDIESVRDVAEALDSLSELICRIERSSLGEYSWPFVDEFKEISKAICTETRHIGPSLTPKVHVIAEGGLSSYSIYSDSNRDIHKRRIFTIVFPRTLKHYVLLHTILGHEVGHAIYNLPQIQSKLNDIFINNLILHSQVFKDHTAVINWLYSKSAPKEVTAALKELEKESYIGPNDFFFAFADYDAWLQEFLCDLIGLLMFGPSYLAAHCDLLYSNDPSGKVFFKEHPLIGCRVNILLVAAQELGYDKWVFDASIQPAVDMFWKDLHSKRQDDPWFDVFSRESIKKTIELLQNYLGSFDKTLYPDPEAAEIEKLVSKILDRCPPVGYHYDDGPKCKHVDFRQIIFAGWIAHSHTDTGITFSEINRLCEHGIMQQASIKLMLNKALKETKNKN